jgi:hypothetical protein
MGIPLAVTGKRDFLWRKKHFNSYNRSGEKMRQDMLVSNML